MYKAVLCFAVLACSAFAAPPTLEVPVEVRPSGGYARMTPKGDCVSVIYVSLDGADPFPSEELKDARRFLLPVQGLKPGRYRFVAVGAGKDGEQARADFAVQVAEIQTGPPKPDKPPENPPTQPATGKVWAIIVQPDGPVQADVESVAKSLEKRDKPGVFQMYRVAFSKLQPDILAELPKDALPAPEKPFRSMFLIRREKKTTDGATVTETVVSARPLPSVAQAETLVAEVLK